MTHPSHDALNAVVSLYGADADRAEIFFPHTQGSAPVVLTVGDLRAAATAITDLTTELEETADALASAYEELDGTKAMLRALAAQLEAERAKLKNVEAERP